MREYIYDLIQKEQDIQVQIQLNEVYPDCPRVYSLERAERDAGTEMVFEKRQLSWDDHDLICEDSYCSDSTWRNYICEDEYSSCIDCNGDGIPECPSSCYLQCVLTVIDTCVPHGDVNYTLFDHPVRDNYMGCWDADARSVLVTDVGQRCPATADERFKCVDEAYDAGPEFDCWEKSDPIDSGTGADEPGDDSDTGICNFTAHRPKSDWLRGVLSVL
jgi:hypothetical protein